MAHLWSRVTRSSQPSGWTAGPRHSGAPPRTNSVWCRKGWVRNALPTPTCHVRTNSVWCRKGWVRKTLPTPSTKCRRVVRGSRCTTGAAWLARPNHRVGRGPRHIGAPPRANSVLASEGLGKKHASDTKHKVPTDGPGQPVYHGRRVARSPQPSGWTAGPRHTGASSAAELGWCRKGCRLVGNAIGNQPPDDGGSCSAVNGPRKG